MVAGSEDLARSLELVLERLTTEPEREMEGPGESHPERFLSDLAKEFNHSGKLFQIIPCTLSRS